MKRTVVVAFVICLTACSRDAIPPRVEAQIKGIASNIAVINKEWWRRRGVLMGDIHELPSSRLKVASLQCLVDSMLDADLFSPDVADSRSTVSAVSDCIDEAIGAVGFSGGTIEDAWNMRMKYLVWMRTQAKRFYGDGNLPDGITRLKSGGLQILDGKAYEQYSKRRGAYNFIAAAYNERLNYAEKRFPNPSDGKIDETRIPELKKKIEKFLGRPMRTPKQCDEDWYNNKHEFPKW